MGLLKRHPQTTTTVNASFWTSSRKWGILRVITAIALGILLVGINSAIDKHKREVTGGRQGNMDDGVIMYNLPHTSYRDYSHRALQGATNYFKDHRDGAIVFGRTRDAILALQGLFVAIWVFRDHALGCRFIIEFATYIVLREFATIMFWEPIPEDAVYGPPSEIDADTDHFFSGHVCTTFIFTIELIRAAHAYRLPIRLSVIGINYIISIFILLVQLILRVHYFADVFTAFFVAHLICATYHLLEMHHMIPKALMDETVDGHVARPNQHGATRNSAADTDGHMEQVGSQPHNHEQTYAHDTHHHALPDHSSYRPGLTAPGEQQQYGAQPIENIV